MGSKRSLNCREKILDFSLKNKAFGLPFRKISAFFGESEILCRLEYSLAKGQLAVGALAAICRRETTARLFMAIEP